MKKTAIIHIYNFIRMSHTEPSRFLFDDFDTLRRMLILVKQYGFPGTYALKYDALMEPRYQELLTEYLDENDEAILFMGNGDDQNLLALLTFYPGRMKLDIVEGNVYGLPEDTVIWFE